MLTPMDPVAPPPPSRVVAIGYVYLNTDLSGSGHGTLDEQQSAIERYVQAQGMTLQEVVQETSDAISTRRQPKLERLIRGDWGMNWDVLLVARLDRLTRNVKHLQAISSRIHEGAGRRLISIEEGIDTRTDAGRFCLRLVDIFSAWDAGALRDRTREWIAKKRERGEPIGHAPFGYIYENKKLVVSPQEASVMQVIRDLRATQLSYEKIARYLNTKKIPSKRGGGWYPETVKAVYSRSFGGQESAPE